MTVRLGGRGPTLTSILLVGLASSMPAIAAPDTARLAQARAIYKVANGLYKGGKFAEALARYGQVYELAQRPSALFNIANCYRHLGQRVKAVTYYELFISEWTAKHPTRKVSELQIARKRIKELEQRQPARNQTATQPTTTGPVAQPPKPAPRLTLVPTPTVPRSAVVITKPPPAAPRRPTRPFYKKWWFWTIVGAAVAGGAAAVAITTTGGDDRRPGGTVVSWEAFIR